ncbi:serine/arginine repetitive matrix protein 1-like [Macrosteles quadrilineatus]|uniref:serine/arginine repetitive matrix protein 1-like n=1 Tax=Macrosteles quadrilineatus TaxID=74068 RepID=UPI0023E21347|nr:serine/arginine repetitive matrix protein 1-like [Macrosteles quadrilineatus]
MASDPRPSTPSRDILDPEDMVLDQEIGDFLAANWSWPFRVDPGDVLDLECSDLEEGEVPARSSPRATEPSPQPDRPTSPTVDPQPAVVSPPAASPPLRVRFASSPRRRIQISPPRSLQISPPRSHHRPASPPRSHRCPASPSRHHHRPASPPRPHRRPASPSRLPRRPASPPRPHRRPASPSRPPRRPASPSRHHRRPTSPSRRHHRPASPPRHPRRPASPPHRRCRPVSSSRHSCRPVSSSRHSCRPASPPSRHPGPAALPRPRLVLPTRRLPERRRRDSPPRRPRLGEAPAGAGAGPARRRPSPIIWEPARPSGLARAPVRRTEPEETVTGNALPLSRAVLLRLVAAYNQLTPEQRRNKRWRIMLGGDRYVRLRPSQVLRVVRGRLPELRRRFQQQGGNRPR